VSTLSRSLPKFAQASRVKKYQYTFERLDSELTVQPESGAQLFVGATMRVGLFAIAIPLILPVGLAAGR